MKRTVIAAVACAATMTAGQAEPAASPPALMKGFGGMSRAPVPGNHWNRMER